MKFKEEDFFTKKITNDVIKGMGWQYKEIRGQANIYHRGFNGSSWYELEDDCDYVTVTSVRFTGSNTTTKVLFQGYIEYYQDLRKICEILKIGV